MKINVDTINKSKIQWTFFRDSFEIFGDKDFMWQFAFLIQMSRSWMLFIKVRLMLFDLICEYRHFHEIQIIICDEKKIIFQFWLFIEVKIKDQSSGQTVAAGLIIPVGKIFVITRTFIYYNLSVVVKLMVDA